MAGAPPVTVTHRGSVHVTPSTAAVGGGQSGVAMTEVEPRLQSPGSRAGLSVRAHAQTGQEILPNKSRHDY